MSLKKPYLNQNIVLLTNHGKEVVIKPILERETGCHLIIENRINTDRFGTFSRSVKRPKTQFNTAMLKIKKALKLTKQNIGIASEGSFFAHPVAMTAWNVEMVVLYDKREGLKLCGVHETSETNFDFRWIECYEEAVTFARKIGFPEHYVILRPDSELSKQIFKDINNFEQLKICFENAMAISKNKRVLIETDMRAHANPTRMKAIEKATQDLIKKLLISCPRCDAPGFMVAKSIKGLPCSRCGTPSDFVQKEISSCYRCGHKATHEYPLGKYIPEEYCHFCNP